MPPLHQLWGVELNGPDQGGHRFLLPFASVTCCDQPVAQTQLSSWPWKSQWCSRRLSLAIEFSCTASKSCKEKSWHCQFIFSSESPWAEKFPSLDVPLETADAESIECIRSPLSLQGCCLFSCAVWRIWKATSCMLPVARYPELAGCVLWLQYPVCSRDMWLQEMRGYKALSICLCLWTVPHKNDGSGRHSKWSPRSLTQNNHIILHQIFWDIFSLVGSKLNILP